MTGYFISFEGGEGAGKSTQVRLLAERLRAAGREVTLTREPGGSAGAEIIRHVILTGGVRAFGPLAEALMFAAARIDHLAETIVPALKAGHVVICDRFIDSTRVYQGIAGKVPMKDILAIEDITIGEHRPDLTLILDLPPGEGLQRVASRGERPDRFETESLAFHETLRQGFLTIARDEPQRCQVIDALQDVEAVAERIWQLVSKRLNLAP